MQNAAADDVALVPYDRNEAYRAIVADLVSLIEHVQTSLQFTERLIARETSLESQESSTNVIVLDDVSPRYMKAVAALRTCDASLGAALHALRDSSGTDAYAAKASAFSTAGA